MGRVPGEEKIICKEAKRNIRSISFSTGLRFLLILIRVSLPDKII